MRPRVGSTYGPLRVPARTNRWSLTWRLVARSFVLAPVGVRNPRRIKSQSGCADVQPPVTLCYQAPPAIGDRPRHRNDLDSRGRPSKI